MRLRLPSKQVLIFSIVVMAVLMGSMAAFAQTNTPIPPTATVTPGLTVPTNEFFTSTNSWISTFAPILAIGVGIAVALAILRFIGKQIVDAF